MGCCDNRCHHILPRASVEGMYVIAQHQLKGINKKQVIGMKKVMLVLGVLLLMSVGLVGCESGVSPPGSVSPSSIAGVYVERLNPSYSLEIHSDGAF